MKKPASKLLSFSALFCVGTTHCCPQSTRSLDQSIVNSAFAAKDWQASVRQLIEANPEGFLESAIAGPRTSLGDAGLLFLVQHYRSRSVAPFSAATHDRLIRHMFKRKWQPYEVDAKLFLAPVPSLALNEDAISHACLSAIRSGDKQRVGFGILALSERKRITDAALIESFVAPYRPGVTEDALSSLRLWRRDLQGYSMPSYLKPKLIEYARQDGPFQLVNEALRVLHVGDPHTAQRLARVGVQSVNPVRRDASRRALEVWGLR